MPKKKTQKVKGMRRNKIRVREVLRKILGSELPDWLKARIARRELNHGTE